MELSKYPYEEKFEKIIYYVAILAIFAFGLWYRLINQRYIGAVLIPICLYYWWKDKKSILDINLVLLIVIFAIIGYEEYIVDPKVPFEYSYIPFALINPLVYLFGKLIIGKSKEECSCRSLGVMCSLTLGMYITWLLDYINKYFNPNKQDMGKTWFVTWVDDYENRNTIDMGLLLLITGLFYFVMNRKRLGKWFYMICGMEILALVINIVNIGRQFEIYHLLFPCLLGAIYMANNWSDFDQKKRDGVGKIFKGLVLAGGVCVIAILFNLKKLVAVYNNSYWSADGGIFKNIRVTLWKDSMTKMIKYPRGGWDAVAADYDWAGTSHNSWIEFGRLHGTVVFILMVLFLLLVIIQAFYITSKVEGNIRITYWVLGAILAFFLYFFINDIGQLYRNTAIYLYFLCGVMRGIGNTVEVDKLDTVKKLY